MKNSRVIQTLWQHAAPRLPDDLLAHLAGGEDAANALRNLSQVMDGLAAALIEVEVDAAAGSGFAEAADLPGLFLGLAAVVETQAELVAVASDAAALLRQRQKASLRPQFW